MDNITPDFELDNYGSVYTLRPLTDAAQQWLDEHVAAESWQYLGGSLGVEHRHIADIVAGAIADGFIVR
jgi:hypothetical protein